MSEEERSIGDVLRETRRNVDMWMGHEEDWAHLAESKPDLIASCAGVAKAMHSVGEHQVARFAEDIVYRLERWYGPDPDDDDDFVSAHDPRLPQLNIGICAWYGPPPGE